MLQRVQTVYLLLIVGLGIFLACVPVVQLTTTEDASVQYMYELGAQGIDNPAADTSLDLQPEPPVLKGLWGLPFTTLLIPLFALVITFLYKKRMLQARLSIFLAVLCLGYYGILFMYIWFAKMNFGMEWHLFGWSCIPLICFVLTLMATRRIIKDEALVRAADRLR